MTIWVPEEGQDNDPRWWEPLEQLTERVAADPSLPTIMPCEFMFMGRADLRGRPSIWLYKHVDTRRYLNLGDDCRAYRYVPPEDVMSADQGRYLLHSEIRRALLHLELSVLTPDQRAKLAQCDRCRELAGALASAHPTRHLT